MGMVKRRKTRAYVVPRYGQRYGGGTYYGVRAGRTLKAPLIKDFYSKKDAVRFRDMINGKIPKDKWFRNQF